MSSNKIIQISGTYYETAMLAVKYQHLFKDCQETQNLKSKYLILSHYSFSDPPEQPDPGYPLCYSFKISFLSEVQHPHQYIMNTINKFPYKLYHVKEHIDAYGIQYIILFN